MFAFAIVIYSTLDKIANHNRYKLHIHSDSHFLAVIRSDTFDSRIVGGKNANSTDHVVSLRQLRSDVPFGR